LHFLIHIWFGFRLLVFKIDPVPDILKRLSNLGVFLKHAEDTIFNIWWDPGRKLPRRILLDVLDCLEGLIPSEHLEEDHACSPDVR